MRLARVQFTIRRMTIAIAIAAVLLAIVVLRHRKIQRLDRLVINQQRTLDSAAASAANTALAREAAEHSLREYAENHHQPRSEISEQFCPLTNHEIELANAENRFARLIRQLDEGTYAAGLDAADRRPDCNQAGPGARETCRGYASEPGCPCSRSP